MLRRGSDRLAQSGGRAAADRDHRVRPKAADELERLLGHLDRGVRNGAGELAHRAVAEQTGHPRGQIGMTAGTENDGSHGVHPVELGADQAIVPTPKTMRSAGA